MRTQVTASAFWTLFQSDLTNSETLPPEEALRHSSILGFTAIDASINTYWSEVILPEWHDYMSLVNVILEDDSELDALHESSKDFLKKSQLVATLRFLSHTGDAEKFSPNFIDLAIVCLLKHKDHDTLIEQLVNLQKHRNHALHTGREWSELTAHQCIKNIKACSVSLSRLHFCFADVFGSPEASNIEVKQAA